MDCNRNMDNNSTMQHMVELNSAKVAEKYTTMYLFNYYNDIL